jgi:hypothetical protein
MKVALQNKPTGEIKLQKIGWSWTCFFGSGLLGIPLFVRGLNVWGTIMILLWTADLLVPLFMISFAFLLSIVVTCIEFGLSIFLGLKANSMAGKRYLETGWEFAEPNSMTTRLARSSWSLPIGSGAAQIALKQSEAAPVILSNQKTAVVPQTTWRLIAAAVVVFFVTFVIILTLGR